jgi:shikimate dehydrogenase
MKVFSILGDERVFKSKSPQMHNGVMQRCNFEGVYVPFPVQPENVENAVNGIRALGIAGSNVTVPHKESVSRLLDTLSEEASLLGAVNTIVRDGNRLEGHNTDIAGFADGLLEDGFEGEGLTALVFGAGGAAKAVLLALRNLKLKDLWITNRSMNRTAPLVSLLGAKAAPLESAREIAAEVDLLINTTSVSMRTEGPEFAEIVGNLPLGRCRLIVDINYGRDENIWRDLARTFEARFMDGIPMLVHQARRSFVLWTGIEPPVEDYYAALQCAP